MGSLAKLWQHWRLRTARTPGYRSGITMQRVLREMLSSWPGQRPLADGRVELLDPQGASVCSLRERVQAHFMLHIVTVEFDWQVAASGFDGMGASIALHHQGWRRRTGLGYRLQGSASPGTMLLGARLCADVQLRDALLALDFSRCRITREATGWRYQIEPFGGSEVVSRLPSFRRYVRLGAVQVHALQQTQIALSRLLAMS